MLEELLYLDYAEDIPDYSNEIWYQDVMSAYQDAREIEYF